MALWLVRGGRYGEHESKFFDDGQVYATWSGFNRDMGRMHGKEELRSALAETYPEFSQKKVINYSGQLWPFAHEMAQGDWIVTPLKNKPAIAFAEVIGPYQHEPAADDPYYHARSVKWLTMDVPRSRFDQDLLYSFGAAMTICGITRNNAEARVRAMAKSGWTDTVRILSETSELDTTTDEPSEDAVDLEQLAKDQIAKLVIAKFKGHGMEMLVQAILEAQGYMTYRSPEGADKGVDIVAAAGPLGFGHPRICVQVKSGQDPVDHPTLSQLIGTMQNVQADHGLLVSWGGFKSSVDRETAQQFFRVRLWDHEDLIDELLQHYDRLAEKIRADIPLKRIWTVAWSAEDTD